MIGHSLGRMEALATMPARGVLVVMYLQLCACARMPIAGFAAATASSMSTIPYHTMTPSLVGELRRLDIDIDLSMLASTKAPMHLRYFFRRLERYVTR